MDRSMRRTQHHGSDIDGTLVPAKHCLPLPKPLDIAAAVRGKTEAPPAKKFLQENYG